MAIKSNIKQALYNKVFLIGVASVCIAIFIASLESVLNTFPLTDFAESGFQAEIFLKALQSDMICLILPILCTLPFAASFLDEMKSGYVKFYLIRTNTDRYIIGKILGNAFAGALTLFLGILLAYGVCLLVNLVLGASPVHGVYALFFGKVLEKAFLFALSGAFWATVGMTFATITNNKYMAYASPFIIFYLLIILYERYFDTFYVLYPKEWLSPSDAWVWGNAGVMLLLAVLIMAGSFVFLIVARRRIATL
jgi:ABC-type transport system involved in multi-copper enzyme maturation permease subunit